MVSDGVGKVDDGVISGIEPDMKSYDMSNTKTSSQATSVREDSRKCPPVKTLL